MSCTCGKYQGCATCGRYQEEGRSMGRNVFENNADNTVEVSMTDLNRLGDKLFSILPPLEVGTRYQLETLSNGRVAVVIEKG